jgi:hypothetical protein
MSINVQGRGVTKYDRSVFQFLGYILDTCSFNHPEELDLIVTYGIHRHLLQVSREGHYQGRGFTE